MIEIKNGQDSWVPVRIFDGTGAAVAGVTFGSVSAAVQKADGSTAVLSVTVTDWLETTAGAFSGEGVYSLKIPASAASINGLLIYAVATPSNKVHVGAVKVVANEEVDTYARIGAPVGASISVDIAAVQTDVNTIDTNVTAIDTKLGIPAGVSVSADIADVPNTVWDEPLAGHATAGTSGKTLSDIAPAAIASAVWDEDVTTHTTANTAGRILTDANHEMFGKWQIFTAGPDMNRLVLYKTDGVTVLKKFDLQDDGGIPTTTNPFIRIPV